MLSYFAERALVLLHGTRHLTKQITQLDRFLFSEL